MIKHIFATSTTASLVLTSFTAFANVHLVDVDVGIFKEDIPLIQSAVDRTNEKLDQVVIQILKPRE